MSEEHWSNEFDHESITDENKEAFSKAMSKYDSPEAAIVGGFNAQKVAGKPFKLPESLDKLPDDTTRADFTSQAHKLLGTEPGIKDIEDLADIDFKAGIAEGAETKVDENLATLLKTMAAEKKWPKSLVQDLVALYNGPLTKYATEASAAKEEAELLAKVKACKEALIAHPDIGSEEKLAEQSELLRRAVKNDVGLTADEYEEFGDEFAKSMLTKNPVVARVMLKVLAPLAAEGTTESGTGVSGGGEGKKQTPHEYKKSRWPKTPSMWGKESDTWDTQSIQLRKQAGIK